MKISDEEAKKYGVGPAGKGGEWILDEKNEKFNRATGKWESTGGKTLILWKNGRAVYNKPITDVKTPTATKEAVRPKELPMTVSSEKLSQKPPVKAKVVPARPVVPTKAGVTPNIPDKVPLVGAMWPPKPPSKGLPPRSGATPPRVSSQPSVTVPEATRTTKPSLSVDTQVKMLGSPPVPRPVTPTTAGDTPNVPDGVNLSAVQPVPKPPVQRPVVPARQIETPNVPEGVNLSAVQPVPEPPPRRPVVPTEAGISSDVPDDVEIEDTISPLIEPVELIVPKKESSDIKKTSSKKMKSVIEDTQEEVGDFESPVDSLIVTTKSLEKAEKGNGTYSIIIDPNNNIAHLMGSSQDTLNTFNIGTGDITGTQYGKKYFTPTGEFEIENEVPYGPVEGSYGPVWMGLNAPKSASGGGYGLHGPHKEVDKAEVGFKNEGFISHGCVRFWEKDLKEVSKYLDKGSKVIILPYSGG